MTWATPTSFPTVPPNTVVAVDTETFCADLKERGPQFITGDDYPIGISLAFDGYSEYFPIAHNMGNCEFDVAGAFRELLSRQDILMIGANTKFDLESLWKAGIEPTCPIHDIQVIEALLDENQKSYSLNTIAVNRGFGGKAQEDLDLWMITHGMVKRGTPDRARYREVPPEIMAPYAAEDASLTLRIYAQQVLEVQKQEGLGQAVALEGALIPVLWRMRRRGVQVDVLRAEALNEKIKQEQEERFASQFPSTLEPWTPASLSRWISTEFGIAIPHTEKERESVTNEWMVGTGIPQLAALAQWRRVDKIRKDYIEGVVLEWNRGGVLHPSWFQTRGMSYRNNDGNGTKTGRIAATMPNLTQIPNRDPDWAPLLRRLFVPRPGEQWCKADFKTQEPRIILHYAYMLGLEGAAAMRQRYVDDPDTDSHQIVTDLVNRYRGDHPLLRKQVKELNLGIPYHLGREKLRYKVKCSMEELLEFIEAYHAGVPYVKPLQQEFIRRVRARGYIKTVYGRRRRFTEYENGEFGAKREKPLPYDQAVAKWGRVKLAKDYTGINAAVQGSASDQTKTALIMMDAEGLEPTIQVYDEINASVGSVSQAKRICEIMENAIPEFTVPHRADGGLGPNWADAKETIR